MYFTGKKRTYMKYTNTRSITGNNVKNLHLWNTNTLKFSNTFKQLVKSWTSKLKMMHMLNKNAPIVLKWGAKMSMLVNLQIHIHSFTKIKICLFGWTNFLIKQEMFVKYGCSHQSLANPPSPTFLTPPPIPRGMQCQSSMCNPYKDLQSKFGYCITILTLNIAFYM